MFGVSLVILLAFLRYRLFKPFDVGLARLRRGRWEEAESFFSAALQKEPGNLRAQVYLASCLHNRGRDGEALDALAGAAVADPLFWPVYQVLNQIYEGRWPEFSRTLPGGGNLAALAPDTISEPRVTWAIYAAYKEGRLAEVINFMEKLAGGENPAKTPVPARVALAWAYNDTGQRDKARDIFEEIIAENPSYAPGLYQLALFYDLAGDREKAFALAETSIKADRNFGPAYNYLGTLLRRQGRVKEAVSMLKKSLDRDPLDSYTPVLLGSMLAQECHYWEAVRVLEGALFRQPGNAQVYLLLGKARYYKEDYLGSRVAFQKALELGLDTSEVRYLLGNVQEITKKLDDALLNFLHAARRDRTGPFGKKAVRFLFDLYRKMEKKF